MEATSRYYLALVRRMEGDLAGAEGDARDALDVAMVPKELPTIEAEGRAVLATILLAQRRSAEALVEARRAHDIPRSLGGIDGGESLIRFAWAQAVADCGDVEAKRAFADAAARLHERAKKIVDPRLRTCSLTCVPENAATIAAAEG